MRFVFSVCRRSTLGPSKKQLRTARRYRHPHRPRHPRRRLPSPPHPRHPIRPAPQHWLIDAADRLAIAGFRNAFNLTPDTITGTTPSAIFASGLQGIWQTKAGTLEDAIANLTKAARNPNLPQDTRHFFALRHARALQITTGWDTPPYDN